MPVNFSVRLGADPTQFHVLSWGTCPALRTLDLERLIGGLRRFVGDHGEAPAGAVRTDFAAAVRHGAAVLLHREARELLVKEERSLRRSGLSMLEAAYADVDLDRGELVVADAGIPFDEAGFEELRSLAPSPRRPDHAVPFGRYPIAGVVTGGHFGAELTAPQAAFAVLRQVVGGVRETVAADVLAALPDFTRRIPVVQSETSEATRDHVVRLAATLP